MTALVGSNLIYKKIHLNKKFINARKNQTICTNSKYWSFCVNKEKHPIKTLSCVYRNTGTWFSVKSREATT